MISARKATFAATATIVGTAVGAGMFGIPYVFSQAGVLIGVAYILLLGVVVTYTMAAFGAVVSVERDVHQLPGYANKHLGKGWRLITVISVFFGMYAGLIAYTIEIGNFLYALLGDALGGSAILYGFLFWLVASGVVAVGLSAVMRMETALVIFLMVAIVVIAAMSIPHIQIENYAHIDFAFIGTPYGVILFAFGALSAVPEVYRYLKRHKHTEVINRAVVLSMFVVALIFLAFSFTVVGVTGAATTESALLGLGAVIGPHVLTIGAGLGIITMGSSFLMTAMAMSAMYQHDFGRSRWLALSVTLLPPLVFLLFPVASFIQIIGTAGGLTGGFQGIIVWLLYIKLAHDTKFGIRLPRLIIWCFHGIFIVGIGYQIWQFLAA